MLIVKKYVVSYNFVSRTVYQLVFQMIERALFHVDNCYSIPNIRVNAYLCKTNMPSNTAFRGFGAPKAMLAAEAIIRDIAKTIGKSYEEIASINLYKEGDLTHYNQSLEYCTLSRCWQECIDSSNYWQRKKLVEEYNRYETRFCKAS